MTQPRRTFLGWDRPLLHSLRDALAARSLDVLKSSAKTGKGRDSIVAQGVVDLSNVILVLPGARAGRRLIELLVKPVSGEIGAPALLTPRVTTPDGVWELLARDQGGWSTAVATPLQQRMAWVGSLRALPPELMEDVIRQRPAEDELARWLALADMLARARNELAAAGVRCADVPSLVRTLSDEHEVRRWNAIGRAEDAYRDELERAGLMDPIDAHEEVISGSASSCRSLVVIAGVVDVNPSLRRLVRTLGDRCEIVVFAPESSGHAFDEFGGVVPSVWSSREIPIDESRIHIAARLEDQARLALEVAGRLADGLPADQISIGIPEPAVADAIVLLAAQQRVCSQIASEAHTSAGDARASVDAGVPRLRLAPGRSLHTSMPALLLAAVHDCAASASFECFAALMRHTAVHDLIERSLVQSGSSASGGAWLRIVDTYRAEHLHWMYDGSWLTSDVDTQNALSAVHSVLIDLIGGQIAAGSYHPDRAPTGPLPEWLREIGAMLRRVYSPADSGDARAAERTFVDQDIDAAELLIQILTGLLDAVERLDVRQVCSADRAIELVLRLAREVAIPDESDGPAIEVLGWLELAFDDAEVMIITGMNEGVIPGNASAEPLLPNPLRESAGLATRASRYARDAWIMQVLAGTRVGTRFISAQRGERHEPRLPSRLLLAADPVTVAHRMRAWTQSEGGSWAGGGEAVESGRHGSPTLVKVEDSPAATSKPNGITRPKIPTSLRITAFRDYLDSPRAFYYRHIEHIDERAGEPTELDAMQFGTLIHDVMRVLGDSTATTLRDVRRVTAILHSALDAAATQRFGDDPMPAVWLQLQQVHDRLSALAHWQAQWSANGWRVAHVEWSPSQGPGSHGASLLVDGEPMGLRGRIDRIDINDDLGVAYILDYKTGDKAPDHAAIRSASGEWRDLQLPLYRHLAERLELPSTIRFGYIVLPRDPAQAGIKPFEWTDDDLRSADEKAEEVVRAIRRGEFDELGPRPPTTGILARLCGTAYLAETDAEEDDE